LVRYRKVPRGLKSTVAGDGECGRDWVPQSHARTIFSDFGGLGLPGFLFGLLGLGGRSAPFEITRNEQDEQDKI
jgi:hypothetical protein